VRGVAGNQDGINPPFRECRKGGAEAKGGTRGEIGKLFGKGRGGLKRDLLKKWTFFGRWGALEKGGSVVGDLELC